MPTWFPTVVGILMPLLAIVAAHTTLLYPRLFWKCRGYIGRMIRKLWLYLFLFVSIQWVLAAGAFFFLHELPLFARIPYPILAALSGLSVAGVSVVIEVVFFPLLLISPIGKVKKKVLKSVLKSKLTLRMNVKKAVNVCMEQDVYDLQNFDRSGLGLQAKEIRRRIRIVYERHKVEVATDRRDVEFLLFDVDSNPWEQFYLLVPRLGRERLYEQIRNPDKSHCPDWDGSEQRRKVKLTRSSRKPGPGAEALRSRVHDDERIVRKVKKGK